MNLQDELVQLVEEEALVIANDETAKLQQIVLQLFGVGIRRLDSRGGGQRSVAAVGGAQPRGAQPLADALDSLVRPGKRQSPRQHAGGPVVTFEHALSEEPRHLCRDLGRHKRIAVPVATRPEADEQVGLRREVAWKVFPPVCGDQHAPGDVGQDIVEHVLHRPQHPPGFVDRARTLAVGEPGLPELQEKPLGVGRIVLRESHPKVLDDVLDRVGIELGRVCGEHDASGGLPQQVSQIGLAIVPTNPRDQVGCAAWACRVVHERERGVFEGVEEDDLPFEELQEQEERFVSCHVGQRGVLGEETVDDAAWRLALRKGLARVLGEDRKQAADPLQKVERKPQEQPGIETIAGCHVLVEGTLGFALGCHAV